MRIARSIVSLLTLLVVAACTGGSGSSGAGGGCPNDLPPSCPADAASYKATIVPLLQTSCVPCHKPGGVSLHFLQTYDEVFALRGPVLDQVYACKMPSGGYPPLNAAERAALLGWLVCGAPND